MEANKRLVADEAKRKEIRRAIQVISVLMKASLWRHSVNGSHAQGAFRLPSTAYQELVANTVVFSFLKQAVADAKSRSGLLSVTLSVLERHVMSTHVGKLFRELDEAAKRDRDGRRQGDALK
jgi:hypothetical protein